MRKSKSSLCVVLSNAEKRQKLHINWAAFFIFALLAGGFTLALKVNFPSITSSFWVLFAWELIVGCIFILLYGRGFGKWILPAGLGILIVFALVFRRQVMQGAYALGNDALTLLTAKTGKIYLDFAGADEGMVFYGLFPILSLGVLLFSRSAWSGNVLFMLPLTAVVYAAAVWGLIPAGAELGMLLAGAVLLCVTRRGRVNGVQRAFAGAPWYLAVILVCCGIGIGLGFLWEGNLTGGFSERFQDEIHRIRYDEETNSMPEGKLKNLSTWDKTDTPALAVTMEEPEKIYLRGNIYEEYTGTEWTPLSAEKRAEYEELFYWLHADGFFGQSQIGTASKYTQNLLPRTMTVKNLSACSAHGYYPYALYEGGNLDAALIGDAGAAATEEAFTYLAGSVPQWYGVQQTLASAQKRESIADYLTREQAYGAYVKAVDLQLTQDSWAVLDRRLDVDQSAKSLGDIRILIRDYLEDNLVYDENARTLNGNGDFLQYVLEQSGSGYSVHYATAATLMLRYFGVPARYVEGYFLSAEEAAQYVAGEEIVLTEEHAHAWAEYYLSGVGFVPFEVTPGYMDDEELEMGGNAALSADSYAGSNLGFAQVQPPEEIRDGEQDRGKIPLKAEYFIWLAVLLVLFFIARIVYCRSKLKKRLAEIDHADCREGIALRYGYAQYLLRRCKAEPPEGAEAARSLNAEAMFSHHEMTQEQRRQMDEYAQQVLTICKAEWSGWQKLRYRLWDCIY